MEGEIKYKFFWKSKLSNWSPATFTVDNITYNCGEQYMMYQKALLFDDVEIAEQILNSNDPKEQQKLGRNVKNYVDEDWNKVRYQIVKYGLRQRFIQNPVQKQLLLDYKGYQFVEASPYDRIWGIGYNEYNALNHINDWGQNLLGKILTELSNEL